MTKIPCNIYLLEWDENDSGVKSIGRIDLFEDDSLELRFNKEAKPYMRKFIIMNMLEASCFVKEKGTDE